MIAPFVGPPTVGVGCAFSADIDQPSCGQEPTVHLLARAPGWGMVGMLSCDRHAPVARQAGAVTEEHDYSPACAQGCWEMVV